MRPRRPRCLCRAPSASDRTNGGDTPASLARYCHPLGHCRRRKPRRRSWCCDCRATPAHHQVEVTRARKRRTSLTAGRRGYRGRCRSGRRHRARSASSNRRMCRGATGRADIAHIQRTGERPSAQGMAWNQACRFSASSAASSTRSRCAVELSCALL